MNDVTQIVAAIGVITTALTALVPAVIALWRKFSAQQKRLDNFWRARWMRGTAEALSKNFVVEIYGNDTINPDVGGFFAVAVTLDVAVYFQPKAVELRALRAEHNTANIMEFAELLEIKFGPWLARFICVPLKVSEYACLVMAASIADNIPPVEKPS